MSDRLRSLIRDVPDFPKPGILFRDITPLLRDGAGLRELIERLAEPHRGQRIDAVLGVEARGFIVGAALAVQLGVGFAPARKPKKLPAAVDRAQYALEYGTDTIEMHRGTFAAGDRVLVVDDVIATGGTAAAAIELARMQGATVVGASFAIELSFLDGRARLPSDVPVHAVLTY